MDRPTHPAIREANVHEVRQIVEQLTTRKRPTPAKSGISRRLEATEKALRTHALIGLGTTVILAALVFISRSHPLAGTAFAISTLVLLLYMASFLLEIASGWPLFNTLHKTPFVPLFSAIEDALILDLPVVNRLLLCERAAIEYVLAQYRHERWAFEKRGAMIAGALDKLGFFPTIAAFVALALTLWSNVWARELVFVVPAFYFMNFIGYGLTQEMDRVIALLEYSLECATPA
jgi:hypothetical protein